MLRAPGSTLRASPPASNSPSSSAASSSSGTSDDRERRGAVAARAAPGRAGDQLGAELGEPGGAGVEVAAAASRGVSGSHAVFSSTLHVLRRCGGPRGASAGPRRRSWRRGRSCVASWSVRSASASWTKVTRATLCGLRVCCARRIARWISAGGTTIRSLSIRTVCGSAGATCRDVHRAARARCAIASRPFTRGRRRRRRPPPRPRRGTAARRCGARRRSRRATGSTCSMYCRKLRDGPTTSTPLRASRSLSAYSR